ncbi:hypothetical protein [Embleya sp. NBC_00896]|uniref:hypothetical protein n=1 Tax=Embleya sp. NBC_00896 TaxID=2975961 RepID=UPI002F913F46|nr:hypothetical protein OG928_35460 [Embleya sp. NBC_00896]
MRPAPPAAQRQRAGSRGRVLDELAAAGRIRRQWRPGIHEADEVRVVDDQESGPARIVEPYGGELP